jgi:NADH-quinone oxidoreductase subunit A
MDYVFVFLAVILTAALVFGGLAFSRLVAPRKPGGRKDEPYECGEATIGPTGLHFNVGYYLLALLFLAFALEAAFLYPWATVLRSIGWPGLIAGVIFIAVLLLAEAYAWRKGALEWH